MKRNAKKIISISLSLCMFVGLMMISQSASTAASGDNVFSSQMFQDFNGFTELGTTSNNGDGSMRGDGYAEGGLTSAFANLSLSNEYSYGNDGGSSFKYESFDHGAHDYNTQITFYTPAEKGSQDKSLIVPAEATGFSFWYLNKSQNNIMINFYPITSDGSRNYRWNSGNIGSTSEPVWTKKTVRFDEFAGASGAFDSLSAATTFPPRSLWDDVIGLQLRIGSYIRQDTLLYIDNIEWIFDNVIEDFENITIGSGTDQIGVTTTHYSGENSAASPAAEIVDFNNAGINTAASFRSDRGKSLKINLGTVKTGNKEAATANPLETGYPRITVTIPLGDANLVGQSLKFYVRYENENPSASGVLDIRPMLENEYGNNNTTGRFRMTQYGFSVDITNGDANTTNHAKLISQVYSSFRVNDSWQRPAGANKSMIVDHLKCGKLLYIYIMPRVESSGGTVYIDSITVTDPVDISELNDARNRATAVKGAPGYDPNVALETALTNANSFYNMAAVNATIDEFNAVNDPLWNQLDTIAVNGLPKVLLKDSSANKAVVAASLGVTEDSLSILNLLKLKNKLIR